MNSRTLIGLWKANVPPWIWSCFPLWIGAIIIGLDGAAPEWGAIALFLVTVTIIMGIAEFANVYADRDEDRLYFPGNPLVAGELDTVTARKVFILQNIVAGLLLVALLLVTLNYFLVITMIVGWFVGLAYSVPPLRLKETVVGPFLFALGVALLPVVAWLSVEPALNDSDDFIVVAFAAFLFFHNFGVGITLKFRKTFHALDCGLIQVEQGGSIYNLSTVDFKLKVKTAMSLEAVTILGAFVLVPIFWRLGIFDSALSIGLLVVPFALALLAIGFRVKDPVDNGPKCWLFMAISWEFIVLLFFAVALTSLLHWGFAVLACIVFLIGFLLLLRTMMPFGRKSLAAPLLEI